MVQVRGWSGDVLAWLNSVKPEQVASSTGQGNCRMLACFAAWVKLGALFEVEGALTSKFIDLAFQLCASQSEGKGCMTVVTA